jgi:hypothetical protein
MPGEWPRCAVVEEDASTHARMPISTQFIRLGVMTTSTLA